MESPVLETPQARYVVQAYLTEGGMGAIYLGKRVGASGFEKEVVLKQLLPEYTENQEFIDLFLREARLSASLDHPNIVHTLDLVAHERDYFIVMEYVRGGDVRTLIKRAKRRGYPQWHPAAGLYVGEQVLEALGYAHSLIGPNNEPLRLIHRDVSPANILLSHRGEVKLTDFGIAKASTHRSVLYKVKGKLGYMSPEQARGEPLDHRSDIFSCAVSLYELFIGERLFVADLAMRPSEIFGQPIPRLSSKRTDLPRELDGIMAKALSLAPDQRYSEAAEFAEALRRVAERSGMRFMPSDLSTHLREILGDDPRQWMRIDDVDMNPAALNATAGIGDGTAALAPGEAFGQMESTDNSAAFTQFTGRELSSVLPHGPAGRFAEPTGTGSRDPQHNFDYHGPLPGAPEAWSDEQAATSPLAPTYTPPPAGARAAGPLGATQQPHLSSAASAAGAAGASGASGASGARYSGLGHNIPPRSEPTYTDRAQRRIADQLGDGRTYGPPGPGTSGMGQAEPFSGRALGSLRSRIAVGAVVVGAITMTTLYFALRERPAARTGPSVTERGLFPAKSSLPDAAAGWATNLEAGRLATQRVAGTNSPRNAPQIPNEARGSAPAGTGQTLEVDSLPAGAEVYLGTSLQCRTPCRITSLPSDPIYALHVRHPDYVLWSALIDLRQSTSRSLTALLRPMPPSDEVGYVRIQSTPTADVYFNGRELGAVTNHEAIPVRAGSYELMLVHPRIAKKKSTLVQVEPGGTVNLSLSLK